MDLSCVTVLIPAHNRPEHLRRLLGYYRATNIHVLVADSSAKPCEDAEIRKGVNYYFFASERFLRKIYNVLPYIRTPYVFFCADDDFIVPEAIEQIVDFLDKNRYYVSAQGHYLTFERRPKGIEFSARYIRNFDKRMDGADGVMRLGEYRNLYASMLYSVCRTEVFREMYSKVIDSDGKLLFDNLYLAEEYFNLYTLICGKHATLPVFYAAREYIRGSAADSTPPLSAVISEPHFRTEYEAFLHILTDKLAETAGIDREKSRKLIDAIMRRGKMNENWSFRRRLVGFLRKYLRFGFTEKLFVSRYKAKGRKIVKGMESYPLQTPTPELKAIICSIEGRR